MKMWWQLKSAWKSFQHLLFSLRWKVAEKFFLSTSSCCSPYLRLFQLSLSPSFPIQSLALALPFTLSIARFNVQPQKKNCEGRIAVCFFPLLCIRFSIFDLSAVCFGVSVVCGRWNGRELHVLNRQIFRRWSGWSDGNTTTTSEWKREREKSECKEADKLFLSSLFSQIV